MSNRGNTALGLAIALGLACQGCILWMGDYTPAVPEHAGASAAPPEAPRIRWTIHHVNASEGVDGGEAAFTGAKQHTGIKDALARLQRTTPFLAKASVDEPDPEYLLELYTAVEERGAINAFFCGLTLGVVPLYLRSEVRVMAALQTPAGESVISHQSTQQVRGIGQLLLVFALPWTLTHPIDDEAYGVPLRSAIDAVARDYAHLRATAAAEVQPTD
jgi:hypothetical protein